MPTDSSAPRADLFRMVGVRDAEVTVRSADGNSDDGRIGTLVGYAAVFNADTVIDSWEGRFTERIAPGAFSRTLARQGDKVKVLFNHGFDPSIGDKPLGKPEVMREDKRGLWVEVPLDDTSYNRDLVASLRSGALDGMSFRFSVKDEDPAKPSNNNVRTLREVELFELGPVTWPAYSATTAGVRSRAAYEAWRAMNEPKPLPEHGSSPSDSAPAEPGSSPSEVPVQRATTGALVHARLIRLASLETPR